MTVSMIIVLHLEETLFFAPMWAPKGKGIFSGTGWGGGRPVSPFQ